jgi:LPPG:FO 2-phospho-L-lactate transferase
MAELGVAPDNDAVAAHYAPLLDAMLHDDSDRPPAGLPAGATATLMHDLDDRIRVARAALALAERLRAT